MPTMAPTTRTSPTCSWRSTSGTSSSLAIRSSSATLSRTPPVAISSRLASAPAHAAGTQAKVPPETADASAITFSEPSVAAIGWPPPANPLPSSRMSGSRPHSSAANSLPERPMPVCTSSRIISQP